MPVAGIPEQVVEPAPPTATVAVLGVDYVGLSPVLAVREGDTVRRGQMLFTDSGNPGVNFTAPAAGRVVVINRSDIRSLDSVVIEVDGDDAETFPVHSPPQLSTIEAPAVRSQLAASGLWTALRRRPGGRVPRLNETPQALFVQAIDTNPLAALPPVIIAEHPGEFRAGLTVLRRLTEGPLYVCAAPDAKIPGSDVPGVTLARFAGPHPAGLPGTHIHKLAPVNDKTSSWYIGYQDVIAIGKLFLTGQFCSERVIALGGPQVLRPRLLRTQVGTNISDLCAGQLNEGENRIISGSVLSGRTCSAGALNFLGRYHTQVSVLKEGRDREFLGWKKPGLNRFSASPVFASALAADGRHFAMTTTLNGGQRSLLPLGAFEAVMPLDIEPHYLLRSLVSQDAEQAKLLGALELEEEDLALCTFVDPGKHEFGEMLRGVLTQLETSG